MPFLAGTLSLSGAAALAQEAARPADEQIEEVVVTSHVIFTENDAYGATKMGLALKDTPQTVTVVTADMIDFAGMKTFNDFYKVDASGGTAHTFDGFPRNYYRGFRQQGINAIRVDGFRMPGNIDLDFAVFDRFEVIKGPTSTLYGQNSIGGTLNAVSKRPQDKFHGELALEGGQFDEIRADVDLTGPINDQWSYRLIGAYDDAGSFLDFANDELKLASMSLQYRAERCHALHRSRDLAGHAHPAAFRTWAATRRQRRGRRHSRSRGRRGPERAGRAALALLRHALEPCRHRSEVHPVRRRARLLERLEVARARAVQRREVQRRCAFRAGAIRRGRLELLHVRLWPQ